MFTSPGVRFRPVPRQRRASALLVGAVAALYFLAAPPGDPTKPAVTGHTDAQGKFTFAADRDGFWSAEARSPDYVARVMIRVGGEQRSPNWLSSFLVIAFLVALLALAVWYRLVRMRAHGRRP